MYTFGTKEFFEYLKETVNRDREFRRLGKKVYTATELVYLRDLKIGVWQKTVDGQIKELCLVPKKSLSKAEKNAEIVYYIKDYDTLIGLLKGNDSFVSLVIDGTLEFRGPIKKALEFQAASDRMEAIVKRILSESVIPNKIQFYRWAALEGYI
jgi:hypothetical protein